jgi:hypothetical protein
MKNLQKKSGTLLTKKFNVGATLWDGLIYPFRKTKLTRFIAFIFVYSIIAYHAAFLTVMYLIVPTTQNIISEEIYTSLINAIYYLFFALFIGYMVTIIQNSLKDIDVLPKFNNLIKLFFLGIQMSLINIVINILPEYLFKIESSFLFPIELLNQFQPGMSSVEHWVVLGGSNYSTSSSAIIVNQILLFFSVWIICPSIYVSFARRGRLSDLLPLKQYAEIYKDKNYIRLVMLTFVIFRLPTILIDYFAQNLTSDSQNLYYFVFMPLLSSSVYIYLSIAMNRMIGKQWKTIKRFHGDRRLLCDTTIQLRLDKYFK